MPSSGSCMNGQRPDTQKLGEINERPQEEIETSAACHTLCFLHFLNLVSNCK